MKAIQTTEVFDDWFDGLRDQQAKRRIQVRIDRAEDGNFGLAIAFSPILDLDDLVGAVFVFLA